MAMSTTLLSDAELDALAQMLAGMMMIPAATAAAPAPAVVITAAPVPVTTAAATPKKKKKKDKKDNNKPVEAAGSASAASAGSGGGGAGGSSSFGGWTVPPASQNDKNWCKTWMSDSTDDGSCFALMYHHCVDGYGDQGRIPAAIRGVKASALKQVYDVQKGCTHDNNGTVPKYKCFSRPPGEWTSLCVARPDTAGKGKCKKVASDEWRVWVKGEDPSRKEECQFSSLYLKSHFRGDKIQSQYTGKHGRG